MNNEHTATQLTTDLRTTGVLTPRTTELPTSAPTGYNPNTAGDNMHARRRAAIAARKANQ